MATGNVVDGAMNPPKGTQSIDRTVMLMRLIATYGMQGARLADLADDAQLAMPTVHRILKRLCEHGLVAQYKPDLRYRLGALSFELGLAASHRFSIASTYRPMLDAIVEQTGDTVYLVIRSGLDTVCLERLEGSYPIRTLVLRIGDRMPLGLTPGGMALLACLSDADIDHVLAVNAPLYRRFPHMLIDGIRAEIDQVRKDGYAVRKSAMTEGVVGVAMVIPSADRRPFTAVSVGGVDSRMNQAHRTEVARILRKTLADHCARS